MFGSITDKRNKLHNNDCSRLLEKVPAKYVYWDIEQNKDRSIFIKQIRVQNEINQTHYTPLSN